MQCMGVAVEEALKGSEVTVEVTLVKAFISKRNKSKKEIKEVNYKKSREGSN